MQFFEHIVGIEGIKPDSQKVDKLDKLLLSKNILQLRAFLDLKNFSKRLNLYLKYLKRMRNSRLDTVLSQIKNDQEHVIAYASCTLTPAKQNYSIVKLEYLAVIWTLLNSCTINDNKRITRRLTLQEYQFDIKYRASSWNKNADFLTHLPKYLKDNKNKQYNQLYQYLFTLQFDKDITKIENLESKKKQKIILLKIINYTNEIKGTPTSNQI
ncbi:11556_t:CDS:2 [Gigaspora margarita]|uniref:11556_t:CDS:1 n=1 Tax=Gigaspora margarita TaxID=4874 RepID=A0ABN7VM13_GIGMA|nr:11556_t:CDS:2 [Gigaspora margarita]